MGAKRVKTGGDPIRGSLEPFQGTLIEQFAGNIAHTHKHGAAAPYGAYQELRNTLKADAAILVRRAAIQCGIYRPISDESRQIIDERLVDVFGHPYCHSFVLCVLDTYNDRAAPDVLNETKCNTPVPSKAMQHAKMDIKRGMKTYIKPILRCMEAHPGMFQPELIERYRDIDTAVDFVCAYFKGIFCENLPQTMKAVLYKRARQCDPRIEHYYVLSEDGETYKLINRTKRKMFSAVSQECATHIICGRWIEARQ